MPTILGVPLTVGAPLGVAGKSRPGVCASFVGRALRRRDSSNAKAFYDVRRLDKKVLIAA